jgi:hypothetical protein
MSDQFAFSITTTKTVWMCRGPGASATGARSPCVQGSGARVDEHANESNEHATIRTLDDMERVSSMRRAESTPSDERGPSVDEATSFSDWNASTTGAREQPC